MTSTSPLGIAILIVLAVFVVGINLGLVSLLRNKNQSKNQNIFNNVQKIIRNPWDEENKQWKKLSDEVAHLYKNKESQDGQHES